MSKLHFMILKCVFTDLLQGPYEVGNMLLGIEGVVQIMFTLANSDNIHYQVCLSSVNNLHMV